ncbi:MAG: DNA-binding response regulator [Dehalococcoidia bacterium]|nr:DNA-binding response regulator [Dehalococcoidia bacterium]
MRVMILHQSEGAAYLQRDLAAFDIEVETGSLSDAEEALAQPGFDAVILEAGANADETRRLLESPTRPARLPVLLLLRVEQMTGIDPSWPVDDFIVLPAAAEELQLRLRRAVWRKTGLDAASTLRSGDLLVDLANYKVFVSEQAVSLTFKEFELLRFLMTNRGKVFTREALLNRVWGYEYYGGARTVDVHIRRLRSKIETNSTLYIETVRNVGYRFPAE